MRSIDIIEALEAEIGKPVITSNQAMLWECLRLLGLKETINGYGRLLKGN